MREAVCQLAYNECVCGLGAWSWQANIGNEERHASRGTGIIEDPEVPILSAGRDAFRAGST